MLGLVMLPVGLMAIAFWKEKQWVMMMAGIAFIGLGAYGLIDADGTWNSSMIVGSASIIFAVAVLTYAMLSMRHKPDPIDEVDEDEEERKSRWDKWHERDRIRKEKKDEL